MVTAAGAEVFVELRLVDLIQAQNMVSGPICEGGIFDVFSEDARALFVSASEQAAA